MGKTKAQGTPEEEDIDLTKCEGCSRWIEIRKRLRISKLLATTIAKLEARFTEDDFKPTVGDYLKLVEMEQDLEQVSQSGKEVQATWVDPTTSSSDE